MTNTFQLKDYDNEQTSPKIRIFVRHLVPPNKTDALKKMPFFLYLQVRECI